MFDRLFDTTTDEQLIQKAAHNHHDFARLYDRFVNDVYRFVGYYVFDRDDQCDLVSQVFMVVATKIGDYNSSKSSFKTWLFGIARHKLADHRRSVYRNQAPQQLDHTTYDTGSDENITDILSTSMQYDTIISLVQQLPKQQSSIFLLRYVENLTNTEIADLTNLDPKTISSVISMVHRKIKQHYAHIA